MEKLTWTNDQMQEAQRIVVERFAMNSVAGHLADHATVGESETTVKRNRFDTRTGRVLDRETLELYEPYAYCWLTKAQVDEFASSINNAMSTNNGASTNNDASTNNGVSTNNATSTSNGTSTNNGASTNNTTSTNHATRPPKPTQAKAVTSLTRAASRLARWHDILFFAGFDESAKPAGVEIGPQCGNPPQSLRCAALDAESMDTSSPPYIEVTTPFNERLVDAVHQAVLRLETRGYYTAYHLVLGERLWQALPRERIKDTLIGDGDFHRTTALPPNEALLVSKDGPTFDCVIAGDPEQQPRFEFLRVEKDDSNEEAYLFQIRERFTPRVRECQAIIRLVADDRAGSAKPKASDAKRKASAAESL